MENKEWAEVFISNNSLQTFVDRQFRKTKPINPHPRFGKYWVPIEMYNYLKYLQSMSCNNYEVTIADYPDHLCFAITVISISFCFPLVFKTTISIM